MAGRGNNTLVMTVELQADSKGLNSTFNLAEGAAKELSKAITTAFAFKTDGAINELKKFAVAKDNLIKNVQFLGKELNKAFDFKTATAIKNLGSVNTELKKLSTQADTTTKKLNSVKFMVGDNNKNINSVISRLEKLEQVADRVAKKLNSVKVTFDSSPTSSNTSRSTTSSASSNSNSSKNLVPGVDYFPTITNKQVYEMFTSNGFSPTVSRILTKLTTYNGKVPQGAPTSPTISNLVFDAGFKITNCF